MNTGKSVKTPDAPNAPDGASAAAASPPAAKATLQMRHPATGDQVDVPLGYSLPVLLLGPIELVRRRDWPLAAVSVLLPVVGQLCLAPFANRAYLKRLVRRGFRAVGGEPGQISRVEWQLGMQLPRYTGRSTRSAD